MSTCSKVMSLWEAPRGLSASSSPTPDQSVQPPWHELCSAQRGSGDTKDMGKDTFLGSGPAEGTGWAWAMCPTDTGMCRVCWHWGHSVGAASQARSCETPGAQPPGETSGWRQSCYKRRGVGEFSFPATSSEALICCSCRGVGSLPPALVSSGWLGWAQPLKKEQGAQAGAAGSPHSCTSPGKFSLQPAVPWDTRDGTLHGGEILRNVPVAMGRWCPGSPRASGQADRKSVV